MRRVANRLLYLFSFSLLFVALYLNFIYKEDTDILPAPNPGKKEMLTSASLQKNSVATQTEKDPVLK